MTDKVQPAAASTNFPECKEAVCVSTKKIFDSCRDKDCIEDLRVFLSQEDQEILERGNSVKPRCADLLYVYIDVEPIPFNCGYYTIDIQYFYRLEADIYGCGIRPFATVSGLAVFNKKVMLFGSEGNAKSFSSKTTVESIDKQFLCAANLPEAVVEAVDPVILDMKIVELCNCQCCESLCDIPTAVEEFFDEPLLDCCNGKRLYASLGQFSIIRLERDVQLLIPSYSYCIPEKDCTGLGAEAAPCEMFQQINFPVDEFFPPQKPED